ncbi:MAG: hypothetical protein HUJ92_07255 [Bacteroidales bacterium]|mgnify:FL=1|nr:hypothetical protein [Bacteroidales bacterium]
MNIAVVSLDDNKKYSFRPDTTLNRDGADFYCPDNFSPILIPCIYTRVLKPAKCVRPRFAERYCSSYDFGLLMDDGLLDPVMAGYIDGSSLLKGDFKPFAETSEKVSLLVDGEEIFSATAEPRNNLFFDAIVQISSRTTLRANDYVVIKLSEGIPASFGKHSVTLACNNINILDFKIL